MIQLCIFNGNRNIVLCKNHSVILKEKLLVFNQIENDSM